MSKIVPSKSLECDDENVISVSSLEKRNKEEDCTNTFVESDVQDIGEKSRRGVLYSPFEIMIIDQKDTMGRWLLGEKMASKVELAYQAFPKGLRTVIVAGSFLSYVPMILVSDQFHVHVLGTIYNIIGLIMFIFQGSRYNRKILALSWTKFNYLFLIGNTLVYHVSVIVLVETTPLRILNALLVVCENMIGFLSDGYPMGGYLRKSVLWLLAPILFFVPISFMFAGLMKDKTISFYGIKVSATSCAVSSGLNIIFFCIYMYNRVRMKRLSFIDAPLRKKKVDMSDEEFLKLRERKQAPFPGKIILQSGYQPISIYWRTDCMALHLFGERFAQRCFQVAKTLRKVMDLLLVICFFSTFVYMLKPRDTRLYVLAAIVAFFNVLRCSFVLLLSSKELVKILLRKYDFYYLSLNSLITLIAYAVLIDATWRDYVLMMMIFTCLILSYLSDCLPTPSSPSIWASFVLFVVVFTWRIASLEGTASFKILEVSITAHSRGIAACFNCMMYGARFTWNSWRQPDELVLAYSHVQVII